MPPVLDQATVFQEYRSSVPADVSASLRAHLAGPHAALHRYANAAEKAAARLGAYAPGSSTAYNWPGKVSGSVVDQPYAKVYVDDALLQYYQDLKAALDTIAPVAGYPNRVATAGARGFKANGASYPRIAALKDRDVKVGDVITIADGSDTLTTTVKDLVADRVNAVINAATSDPANAIAQPNSSPGSAPTIAPTGGGGGGSLAAGVYYVRYGFVGPFGETWSSAAQSFTATGTDVPRVTIPALPTGATSARIYLSPPGGTALQTTLYASGIVATTADLSSAYSSGGAAYVQAVTQTAGTDNGVDATAASAASYNGSATGDVYETYTITVTTASTGGTLTTGRLQVTSASGRDDQTNVTPSATGVATAVGTRGLTVTWTRTSDDFAIGQTWQVTVRQVWAVPVPTSAGTFSGDADVTYVVKVTRGGLYADSAKPQVSVTAAQGTDSSGPTNVTAAAGAVSIGTKGATIAFSGTGLRKGDLYYVSVTGPTSGAYKTLVLANNLSSTLQLSSDVDLTLYVRKSIQIPKNRNSDPPTLNWTTSASQVTLNSGVDAQDDSLTDAGVKFWVPVKGGTAYVEYREWVDTYAARITEVAAEADVISLWPTTYDAPDSVLPYGVWKAVRNSNGQKVKFTAVADPSVAQDWVDVLAILEGLNDVSELVPLDRRSSTISAYRAHVNARASDELGGEWRHAWLNLAAVTSQAVVDATSTGNAQAALATLADDPGATGTQYTYLAVPAGNARFVTNGVAAGDVVRYLYGIDAFGAETYAEFVVASVVNEDTLVLASGHSAAVGTAQRAEVWRNLTRTQSAAGLTAQVAGANLNKRLRFVWPDQVTDDAGNVVEGYFLAAAYAAMAGGVAPQQGFRNVEVGGFSGTPRSTEFFNNAQLNVLGAAGFFVVSTNEDGLVYAKYARTPDVSSVASREEATVRLDDALKYLFYNKSAGFFGRANVTDSALALIDAELKAAAQHAVSDTRVSRIGPMADSADVRTIRRHLTVADRIVVEINVSRGFPLNDATITLVL